MLSKHPVVQIIIAVAALASIGIFVHHSDIEPISTGFYRCILSLPLFIIINKLEKPSVIPLKITTRQLNILTLLGGFGLGMDMCIFNLAFNYTTMAENNLIVNLTPLIVFPASILYFKEKTSWLISIPFAIALFGLYQLVFGGAGTHQIHVTGDLLSLVAALFYALFVVMTKVAADHGADMGRYMIKVSICCAVILFAGGLIMHEHWLPHSLYGWVDLILLAIISQVFGQLLLAKAMKKVPLQLSSSLLLLQPIFAAIYGWVLFNEKLSTMQLFGATLVLVALFAFKYINNINRVRKTIV